MPDDHAKYSPSSLNYLSKCPNYKSEGSSAAAEEGTLMHEAAETGITSKLNDEQIAQVELCKDYWSDMVKIETEVCLELQVHIQDITWGTADVVLRNGTHIDVIDYKFGRLPVPDAEINLQGWAYMLGAWEKFPEAKTGTVHFLLPRRDEITKHTFDREADEDRMLTRIRDVVTIAEAQTDVFRGGSHCRYCSRKSACPAFNEWAVATVPSGQGLPKLVFEEGGLANVNNLSKVLKLKPLFEDYFSQASKAAQQLAMEGQEIPGFDLVSRSSKRVIRDVGSVWAVLQDYDVELIDFLDSCRVNVTDIDRMVKAKAKRGEKQEKIREVHTELTRQGLETSEGEIVYLKKRND